MLKRQKNWQSGTSMKRLKLFPKTFFYTLVSMVFVIAIVRIFIYLLVPQIGMTITITDTAANTAEAIVAPIERISASTERMMKLDRAANCPIHAKDEIGLLAQNVNDLYSNLLSTIEHLEQEKDWVSEMERQRWISCGLRPMN